MIHVAKYNITFKYGKIIGDLKEINCGVSESAPRTWRYLPVCLGTGEVGQPLARNLTTPRYCWDNYN